MAHNFTRISSFINHHQVKLYFYESISRFN
nr:MAG TPA: hypothetical protein [Caudoviricetes sp.]